MLQRLSGMIKILFQRISVERLLSSGARDKIYYDNVDENYLQDLMMTYTSQVSDTEIRLLMREIRAQVNEVGLSIYNPESPNSINAFSTLFFYVPEILTFYENRVVCKYDSLLEWKEIVRVMGEDLPVVAFMVQKDFNCGETRQNFFWPPVIGHNNGQLNRILDKGMSDNHFHLRCAAPYFHISWINLMNNPGRSEFMFPFEKMEKNYRDKHKKAEVGLERQPLRFYVLAAALIRLYLCSRLMEFSIHVSDYYLSDDEVRHEYREIREGDGKSELEEILKSCQNESIRLDTLKEYLPEKKYREILMRKTRKAVESLLADSFQMEVNVSFIQSNIDILRKLADEQDYMLRYSGGNWYEGEEEYQILSGERWFLYQMLHRIWRADKMFSREEYNLFFAYIRIKNELRSELIQTNDIAGFENFQIYQSRKDYFSHIDEWKRAEGKLARLAVRDVLNNSAVKHLEVRITPEDTAAGNAEDIREYDRAIIRKYYEEDDFTEELQIIWQMAKSGSNMQPLAEDDLRQRFHYIFHFTKRYDKIDSGNTAKYLECRHYNYRRELERKAIALINFRKDYPQYGRRVVGIDACAQEIGCRPEVFGRIFRTMKNYVNPFPDMLNKYELPQLKVTYHVGEDFLDVADGLRAIEEAIRFLNLDCGDRLGHALALGIDVNAWYQAKGSRITISLQDYLDNVVWLHHALIKYKIKNMGALKGWLEEKYSQYFAYIYQPYIREMRGMEEYARDMQYQGNFDLNTYYLAWLLRGDKPSLYKSGRFEKKIYYVNQLDRYAVNREHIRSDDIRNIPEVTLMYYMYHYNKEVRDRGSEQKTFFMSDSYIAGVKAVQKKMREEIVKRGISIETTPSSNLQIGTFKSYGEHPIKVFYNHGLTKNERELMECPQINVSINTDNNGVFSTRLENEYALLACAMEKEKTEDGLPRYKKEFIYTWLDNIREMGLRQIFVSDQKHRW